MSLFSGLFKSESNSSDGDIENPSSDKLRRIGNKNIKVISKTLLKEGRQARMVELSAISDKWVASMGGVTKDNVHKVDYEWGEHHGLGKECMCIVTFNKLQTTKNGLAPVLINKRNKMILYGDYELIDLFNWAGEKDKNTVLFRIKSKLFSNARNVCSNNTEILGHTVCKDDVGYYIIRDIPNFSDIKQVTYFLPNNDNVNLVI